LRCCSSYWTLSLKLFNLTAQIELKAIELGERFIESIFQAYEDIPNSDGMKVLRNVVPIDEGEEIGDVVLRKITEEFWSKVIAEVDMYDTRSVCAVGTPGVGKTTTTCILIRLLLTEKKNNSVVFHLRTEKNSGFVYIFTPQSMIKDKVSVDVIQEDQFKILDINKSTVYYVVDPGRTKDNCDLDDKFQGKVIIVASPDERHWGESEFSKVRKGRSGEFLYYPVWNIDELITSSQYFKVSVSEEEIRNRVYQFGGVPRHVFTNNIERTTAVQKRALDRLTTPTAVSLAFRTRSGLMTHSTELPKGILLSYVLADDDEGTFKKAYAVLSSDFVYEAIATKYRSALFTKVNNDRGDFDPYLFESYCRTLLYDTAKRNKTKFRVKRKIGSISQIEHEKWLGGCSSLQRVKDITVSARSEELVLFTPESTKYKLLDFGYRENSVYHMFQATTGKEHSANPEHLYEWIVNEVRHIAPALLTVQKGRKKTNTCPMKFELYYIVPHFVFERFYLRPASATIKAKEVVGKKIGKGTALYTHWDDIVSLYIAFSVAPLSLDDNINVDDVDSMNETD
jgi:hypothetical protein